MDDENKVVRAVNLALQDDEIMLAYLPRLCPMVHIQGVNLV